MQPQTIHAYSNNFRHRFLFSKFNFEDTIFEQVNCSILFAKKSLIVGSNPSISIVVSIIISEINPTKLIKKLKILQSISHMFNPFKKN